MINQHFADYATGGRKSPYFLNARNLRFPYGGEYSGKPDWERENGVGEFFIPVGVMPLRWMIHSPAGTSLVSVPSAARFRERFRTSPAGTDSLGESASTWFCQR